jgi:hypothetical protein
MPQHSQRVAVTATSERVHVLKVAGWNPRSKHIMKIYDHLLRFAVKPNSFVSELNLISQERENAYKTRDGYQRIKRSG